MYGKVKEKYVNIEEKDVLLQYLLYILPASHSGVAKNGFQRIST